MCDHKKTRVADIRQFPNYTRRRRECLDCKERFNTFEIAENVPFEDISKLFGGKATITKKIKKTPEISSYNKQKPISKKQAQKIAITQFVAKLKQIREQYHTTKLPVNVFSENKGGS